jgi:hypothetical protein
LQVARPSFKGFQLHSKAHSLSTGKTFIMELDFARQTL